MIFINKTGRIATYLDKPGKPEANTYLYGDKDQYITEARKTEETLKGNKLFTDRLKIVVFKGIHEVHISFLQKLVGKY